MSLVAATWALAAALGAIDTLEVGLRAEVRGLDGGPAAASLSEPVPYWIEPTLDLTGKFSPRLAYTAALAPRLLLLAGPAGGLAVDSSAEYLVGAASLSWRAHDQVTATLAGFGSRGTLVMSPLAQLGAAGVTAGGAAAPGSGLADPAAGFRTGEFSSAALRASVDWRATPTLTLGGGVGESRSGGVGAAGRTLFPTTETLSAEARASLAISALDGLGVQGSYSRTRLGDQGAAWILGALAQWSHRFALDVRGALGAGVNASVQEGPGATPSTASGHPTPRLEASFDMPPPARGRGLGLSVHFGYAPYVDQYASEIRQRITGSFALDWLLDSEHRISWAANAASAIGSGGSSTAVAATELGGWVRADQLELGLTLRGGYQETQAQGGAVLQWGIGLAARWRRGSSL